MATQNPIELEGTFPLPEAQVDRFFMKVALGYPSEEEENSILLRFEHADPLQDLGPVVSAEHIAEMQQLVRQVRVEDSVRNYVIAVVRATRTHASVEIGASPRGSLYLYHAAQAWAALHGREFVIPDDVKYLAPFVLTHRLIIGAQMRLRGRNAQQIVQEVVSSVPVPVDSG